MEIWSQIGYILLGVAAVISALAMLFSRNTIYAALLLAFNFVTIAVIYLALGAPFIALVQITVYAGSIMVLFMFVIMLLGLLVELIVLLIVQGNYWQPVQSFDQQAGNPAALGSLLFTQYPVLLIALAFILLSATVGAILITRGEGTYSLDYPEKKE
jgi:NADH-quinone oxidoreductase subunit J